jgi:uncharacterized transporter YbjL
MVVSESCPDYGIEPIGLLRDGALGIVVTVLGMLYLPLRRAAPVPDRAGSGVVESYKLSKHFSEVMITPGSPLAGKTQDESGLGQTMDLIVAGLRRGDARNLAPGPKTVLREGDILLVEGRAEDILLVKDTVGVEIKPEFKLTDPDLESESVRMIEGMVLPRSSLIQHTLRACNSVSARA